ncbi:hypothetical protein [Streptomyces collinus]|uniref:hypothetical protein n=1 Tax=Streptomyces collinus TaxID=42684 RepID=UPI00380EE8E0
MSPLTTAAAALGLLAVGYALGRIRPARRASDWANLKKYDQSMRRHSLRWWAVFVVLSVENLVWLLVHPVQGWDAWNHRNDPPPPRSPAPTFDPDWAAKRRAASQEDA